MRISDLSSDVCSSDLLRTRQRIRAPTFWRPNSSVSASSVAVMIRLKRPFGRNADIFGLLLRQLRQLHAELFKMQRSNLPVEMLGDRKSTRLQSSHYCASRMPPSACTHNKNKLTHTYPS